MPELRKDPIVGRWVIISTERGRRPVDFIREPERKKGGFCPFCEGNEDKTPPEVIAYRPENSRRDGTGWNVRVVPNKFPALQIEGDLNKEGEGLYDKMNGIGAHEVIIETPQHNETLATMSVKTIESILWAYRDRILDLKKDIRFKYILIFKNHGEAAGASLEHTHSQLIATPIIPKRVMEEIEGAHSYYKFKERCIYCDIVKQEIAQDLRVIAQNEKFLVIGPFAPRFPFETWILPKEHDSHFEDGDHEQFEKLAVIFKETLLRLNRALDDPAYNYVIHTSPLRDGGSEYYHWHIEIMPKLTRIAGFEWGTGFFINPTSPEEAAKFMREIKL